MAILHLDLPRSADYLNASALSAHPLLLMPEAPDVEHNGEGGIEIVEAHKFGGRPYCVQEPELEGVDELLRRGYFQALQLAFPGARNDARVSGNWPFGDGIFNLFWKEPFESTRPIWYLQG
jgi:hypothetical protein